MDFVLHLDLTVVRMPNFCAALLLSALTIDCAQLGFGHQSKNHALTPAQRLAAIRHARVWKPTNIRSMDMRTGPRGRRFRTRGNGHLRLLAGRVQRRVAEVRLHDRR